LRAFFTNFPVLDTEGRVYFCDCDINPAFSCRSGVGPSTRYSYAQKHLLPSTLFSFI